MRRSDIIHSVGEWDLLRSNRLFRAGNAPELNTAAAAMVLASAAHADRRGLRPVARLVSYGIAAVEPGLVGLGPIPALKQALARVGWSIRDVERIEMNEAFSLLLAPAVIRELGLPPDIVNVEGGAIAHRLLSFAGQPLGCLERWPILARHGR
jgi:acetyl-CoA C-acetyltransferase